MGDTINISGYLVYVLGLVTVIAYLFGSFVYYKKALELHFEELMILDTVVVAAFWSIIVGRISFVLVNISAFVKHFSRVLLLVDFPGIERWGALLGIVFGLYLVVRKKKAKLLDLLDLVTLGLLVGSSFFWVGINFISFYWQNLVVGLYMFLCFTVLWKMEKTYRLVSWYRAGKTFARTGFVASFGIMAIGFGYFIENILFNRLSSSNFLFSLAVLVFGVALVYIRSGRILVEDIKGIKLWKLKIKK